MSNVFLKVKNLQGKFLYINPETIKSFRESVYEDNNFLEVFFDKGHLDLSTKIEDFIKMLQEVNYFIKE